ncbi:MAG: fdnI [Acidimicrobiales bacterium]|nr:fdnI [Acidimicrobiales bacterium]
MAATTSARGPRGSVELGAAPVSAATVDTQVGDRLVRFDRVERTLHWANAVLLLSCLVTGAAMYVPALSGLVGRRRTVENIHVISGLALPVPFVAVLLGRWRRGFVRDAKRLGRFLDDDWRWLRRRPRRSGRLRIGKFNAGQKVNAVLVAGLLPVMLLSGAVMQWNQRFSDAWRTGATFVHDWGFLALFVLTVAHIAKALAEPVLLRSMVRGWVSVSWAAHHRPRWHDEVVGDDPASEVGAPADGA